MKTKVALRKKAVRLHLQGVHKTEIAKRLKKSRRWVYRWVARYDREQGVKSLESRSSAPKNRQEQKYYLIVVRDVFGKKWPCAC